MSEPPSNWLRTTVGAVTINHDNRRIPVKASDRAKRPGPFRYYGAQGIIDHVDDFLFDGTFLLIAEDGANLNSRVQPIAQLVVGQFWVNNHAHIVQARDQIDLRFLKHFLNGHSLEGVVRGTAQPKLTKADLNRLALPLPPLTEQRRIVDILEDHFSRLDAAESLAAATLARTHALRASTLQSKFVGTPIPLGKLSLDSGYGTSTKCGYDGAGVPVVRIPSIASGRIDLSDEKRAIDPLVDLSPLMLAEGDLLLVRTNGSRDLIGRTAVVQSGVAAAFASYLIRFKIDKSRALPQWVQLMLDAPASRRALEGMAASSAGQYNLGLKKLDAVQVPCPDLDTQDRLLAEASETSLGIESIVRSIGQARIRSDALRRSLFNAAFGGTLTGRASDMDLAEEMASV
jgi:type I restriction enzyme, S subunit